MENIALTPETYDAAERVARRGIANRIIEAFQPSSFDRFGYPTRIDTMGELAKYVEVMHEGMPRELLERMLGGLSEEELQLLTQAARMGSDLSHEYSGRRTVPGPSLWPAVLAYRHINFLYPDKHATVLEIGPGDGYLGCMLSLAGYGYVSTDVAQAFYLLQSHLFRRAAGDHFMELANVARDLTDFGEIAPGVSLHVPWWKFASSTPDRIGLKVDCIIGSGVFCEMHPNAFAYLTHQARRWLSGNDGRRKTFYIHGPGAEGVNTLAGVLAKLKAAGFALAHSDKLGAQDSDLPNDIGFFLQPPIVGSNVDSREALGSIIVEGRKRFRSADADSFRRMHDYLSELAGHQDMLTADERFIRFCASGKDA